MSSLFEDEFRTTALPELQTTFGVRVTRKPEGARTPVVVTTLGIDWLEPVSQDGSGQRKFESRGVMRVPVGTYSMTDLWTVNGLEFVVEALPPPDSAVQSIHITRHVVSERGARLGVL